MAFSQEILETIYQTRACDRCRGSVSKVLNLMIYALRGNLTACSRMPRGRLRFFFLCKTKTTHFTHPSSPVCSTGWGATHTLGGHSPQAVQPWGDSVTHSLLISMFQPAVPTFVSPSAKFSSPLTFTITVSSLRANSCVKKARTSM